MSPFESWAIGARSPNTSDRERVFRKERKGKKKNASVNLLESSHGACSTLQLHGGGAHDHHHPSENVCQCPLNADSSRS